MTSKTIPSPEKIASSSSGATSPAPGVAPLPGTAPLPGVAPGAHAPRPKAPAHGSPPAPGPLQNTSLADPALRRPAPPKQGRSWLGMLTQTVLIAGLLGGVYYAYTHGLLTKEAIEKLMHRDSHVAAPPKRITPVVSAVVRRVT